MYYRLSFPSHNWRIIMNCAGLLLVNAARSAQPTVDPQEQAREIVVPKAIVAAPGASEHLSSAAASALGNRDFDAQAQARQFIAAQANLSSAIDSRVTVRAVSAQGNPRADAQEQARLLILAKPNFRLPGSEVLSAAKTKAAREASA
jgi:hypothetical protein